MENNSTGGNERVMDVGLSNGPSFRSHAGRPVSTMSDCDVSAGSPTSRSMSPVSSPPPLPPYHHAHRHPHHHHSLEITITVNKDERGYGMKVSGDNPVYVQSVKEGGAAERAGLHSGDKIMKVNGVDVAHSTHTEVVELIKSANQVTLTVQQRPLHANPLSSPTMTSRTLFHSHSTPSRSITAPQPVDHEKKRQLQCERLHTYRLMLEKEQRYMEGIRSELARCTDPTREAKFVQELAGAERRVRTLQEKLSSQPSKPHTHNHAHHNHDGEHAHTHSTLPSPSVHNTVAAFLDNCREDPGLLPPPLPQRNRSSGSNGAPPRPPVPPPAQLVPSPTHTGLPGLSYLDPPPLPPHPILNSPDQGRDSSPGPPQSPTNSHCSQGSQSNIQTHHRAKSSPDPLSSHLSSAEASKRLIASESLSSLDLSNSKRSKCGWDLDSPRVTPPGTPPPPYGGSSSSSSATPGSEGMDSSPALANTTGESSTFHDENSDASPESGPRPQQQIMSMEDDDMSDEEALEDHGPFKSLALLWKHPAHLAVFMNYVISNSDPSSLLFYLVTDLYKEGNAKEMKKWAYEIHSSFLVPGAPLRLNNVDENVAREVDDILQKESDKEDQLRKVFWKARLKAKEELNDQLADFKQKRTAGLGTLFGPTDIVLNESILDKSSETRIIESILVPKIEPYLDDIEKDNVDIRRYTTAAALGTVMGKVFGLRGPHSSAVLERCPTFVSKDKSLKARLIGKTRKVTIRGHNFNLHQYYTVEYCNHCQHIIWGIGPQGYQCTHCTLNVHRNCVKVVDEICIGPQAKEKKERGNAGISKLMERIRERETRRKPSSLNLTKRQTEDRDESSSSAPLDGDLASGDRPVAGRLADKRPDSVTEERHGHAAACAAHGTQDQSPGQGGQAGQPADQRPEDQHHQLPQHHMPKTKPSSTSINRSESYKERVSQKRKERRKVSDPNLSKSNDADLEAPALANQSGSSSNSSLSTRSLDSPSNSLEAVGVGHSGQTSGGSVATGVPVGAPPQWDSDTEAEPDPPDWTKGVSEETLKGLSSHEKKRQEVINELFHTERSHVRNLKVLDMVFFRPMYEAGVLPADQLSLLFANLDQMLEIHSTFNNHCKIRRRECPVVGDIGDLLLSMFDGQPGDDFQKAAATFCARQQIALESLKERRKKDAKLQNFLADAEGNPMCRRLQLKDILPSGMLRLTKYPLLFENLAKYTSGGPESVEYKSVQRALERSKEILNYVNGAVKEAEDHQRLIEIQKRLDRSAFEKVDHTVAGEFKNLDLTKHRLIHEGPLNWRIGNRQKLIDLHVLLLEELIILLQRQDDKLVLKFYNVNTASGGSSERTPTLSPIIKVSTVLVRHNAVDKKALYLVNTSHNGAQIYDLVATSSSERKTWFRHISEAADKYKTDSKNRRSELISVPQDDTTDNHLDKTKESDDFVSSPAQGGPDDDNSAASGPVGGSPNAESPSAGSVGSPSVEPPSPSTPTRGSGEAMMSPSLRRRGEPLRLTTEESPLIEPSEVTVSQRPVLTAEPVLTPIEKLRRKDEAIRKALAEKQQLVADILHIPREDFNTIAELAAQPSHDKEASELVLAAINQASQLSSVLNECLRVSEEDAVVATSGNSPRQNRRSACMPAVPTHRLLDVSTSLNAQLTQLLKMMKERDEERERLRRELQRSREQLHVMHESQRRRGNSREKQTSLDTTDEQSDDQGHLPAVCDNDEEDEGLSNEMKRLSVGKDDELDAGVTSTSTPQTKAVKDTRQKEPTPEPGMESRPAEAEAEAHPF